MQHMSSRLLRAQFTYAWNVAGALVSLNNMTVYLKYLYLVQKAVIHFLSSLIQMQWYASLKSNLVYILVLESLSKISDTNSKR